jgi:3-oxoacyl-[acyl-carrier-protein] synthase-3
VHGTRIVGWGTALPDKTVTNHDLEARLDTSDAWITERTGIRERRIGDSTAALAVEAGRNAIEHAGLRPTDIDMVVLATTTPDQTMPATSAQVQDELGIPGGAFDINAACSGFVYSLVSAAGLVALGTRRVLLIGAETMSRIIDWEDRNTAVLFGDAGAAVVLEATAEPGQLVGWDLGADGGARPLLYADRGDYIQMEGPELFRRAVRVGVESCLRSLDQAGLSPDDVDLFVPHQANIRIIDAATQRLGIPMERTAITLDRTGNTSAASIPFALAEALDAGRLDDGGHALLVGFGAGLTWASCVLRWGS